MTIEAVVPHGRLWSCVSTDTKPVGWADGLFMDEIDTGDRYVSKNGVFVRKFAGEDWASIAAQGAGFASDTYLTDSFLQLPAYSMQARMVFIWRISVSKTAAGTAAPVYQVRIGANKSTADTSRLSMTGSAQTAAADVALIEIMVTVRSVGVAGVIQGTVSMKHNAAARGFANNDAGAVEATSAGFDNTNLGGQFVGLSINGGASAAWTVTQVYAHVDY